MEKQKKKWLLISTKQLDVREVLNKTTGHVWGQIPLDGFRYGGSSDTSSGLEVDAEFVRTDEGGKRVPFKICHSLCKLPADLHIEVETDLQRKIGNVCYPCPFILNEMRGFLVIPLNNGLLYPTRDLTFPNQGVRWGRIDRSILSIHRLVFAAGQFTDSALTAFHQATIPEPEPGEAFGTMDEWRMGVERCTGWLGQPLGPAIHLAWKERDLLEGARKTLPKDFVQGSEAKKRKI